MSVIKALKCLVDLMSEAVDTDSRFEQLLRDMREAFLGRSIVKTLSNADRGSRFKQLIQASAVFGDTGLDLLWDALDGIVDDFQTIKPRLNDAFQLYRDERRNENQINSPALTRCMEDAAEHGRLLRDRLQDLASQYSQLEPLRLQEAIAKAMGQVFPNQLPRTRYPSVFDNGPIADWSDFLNRTSPDPFQLDKGFLDALENVLSLPLSAHAHLDSTELSSLIVMVLEPPDLPDGTPCEKYAFRAFFCPNEAATPDQWMAVDDKDAGYPIKAAAFLNDLQALLLKALDCALIQLPQSAELLLLEIFLPRKFLNMDIGKMITFSVPGARSEPLSKYYPIVLRSSDRYQNFHERRAKILQNTLPAKWDVARRAPSPVESRCCWWHDTTSMAKKRLSPLNAENETAYLEAEIEDKFDKLRVGKEYFSFRRVANLPSCSQLLETWLIQVINACPAVAIWWRPGAQSSRAQREKSLRFCHDEGHSGFGVDKLSNKKPAHADPFFHPHITSSLKLFHAFASGVFYGRRSEHSLAFGELVLLMESVERWPPRRDSEPAIERKYDQRGQVISVFVDEILYSD